MADNERTYRIIFEADSLDDARQKAAALDSQIDAISGSYRQAAAGQDVAVSRMDRNLEGHYEKIALQTRLLRIQTDQTKGELDKQIALIEERYAFEIAQAKGNARIIKELEAQKTLQIELANQRLQAKSSGATAPIGRLSGAVAGFAALTAAAFAVQPVVNFGKAAISTAANFEAVKVRLDNMYGSVEAGNRAFDNFNRVAATTPFALNEVVAAGATLKAFGIDAEQRIKIVADLAAFMGRSVEDAASALGRAFAGGAGAADIFRETGILNLIKSKQGIDDLTKLTLPQFRDAMFKTFSDPSSGIAGATDKLSKTITGLESNLGDAFDRMLANVGNRFAPGYKSTLAGLISITDSLGNAFASTVDRAKQFETLRIDTGATVSQLQGLTKTIADLGDPARLSAAEQEKLNATYQEIARIVPGAVTQVDAYGNALSVNLNVVNAFIRSQQQLVNSTQNLTLADLRGDLKDAADRFLELQGRIDAAQGRIDALSVANVEAQRQKLLEFSKLAAQGVDIDVLPSTARSAERISEDLNKLRPELIETQKELERLGGAFIRAYSDGDKIDVEKIRLGMQLTKSEFEAVRPAIDAYIRSLDNATGFSKAFNLDKLRRELGLTAVEFNELVNVIESRKEALKVGGVESPELNLRGFSESVQAAAAQYDQFIQSLQSGAFSLPPVTVPEIEIPPVNVPEIEIPTPKVPEIPPIAAPEVEVPAVKIPEVVFPPINAPELPPINAPEVNVPPVTVPPVEIPPIEVPELPAIPAPKIETPKVPEVVFPPIAPPQLPPIAAPSVDMSSIQQQFNLTEQGVNALSIALAAYQAQLNSGAIEQVDANTKKQLEALELQRRTLELQTNIALNEYEKQKAIVAERYASEIRQAGGNVEVIKQLEAIKALEIEKINQQILSDAVKRDAEIAAQGIDAFKRFKAEIDKETQASLLKFEQIEIPPPPPPDPAVLREFDLIQARIEKVGDVFKNSILKQWREGQGVMTAFGEVAKGVLEEIAATIIKNAAIYAIANILTGGSAGALTGGLNAGQFIFGNAFGGGSRLTTGGGNLNLAPAGGTVSLPSSGIAAPNITNNTTVEIKALDSSDVESWLRFRGGAKMIKQTLPEVI